MHPAWSLWGRVREELSMHVKEGNRERKSSAVEISS